MKSEVRKLSLSDTLFDNEFRSNNDFYNDLKHNYIYLGYFINDALVSFINFIKINEELEINYLITKKQEQGKGYASILLEYMIGKYSESVFLEVSENNNVAIDLYKRHGFDIINKRKNYYKDGSDALILRR